MLITPCIALTGVFLFASTTARNSNALLSWNCGYSFTSNIMYGVLYALSPELFPTKDRGTGNAIVSSANRVFGIMVCPLTFKYRTSITMYSIRFDYRPLSLRCTQTLQHRRRYMCRAPFSLSLGSLLCSFHLNPVERHLFEVKSLSNVHHFRHCCRKQSKQNHPYTCRRNRD